MLPARVQLELDQRGPRESFPDDVVRGGIQPLFVGADDAAAVGLAAWPRVVSSLSLPCHTPPAAAAITTAPAAISQRTVRDITLPTERSAAPNGVATFLCEMIGRIRA